jgi:phosphohistidine phosphatase SixA
VTLDAGPWCVLARHAEAEGRTGWAGPDDARELTPEGHAQAGALAARLAWLPVRRVLSSPALRCRQTAAPLAAGLGADVEVCDALRIGSDTFAVVRLLREPETSGSVLLTHREVLEALLPWLTGPGTGPALGIRPMGQAAAWLLRGPVDAGPQLRPLPDRGLVHPMRMEFGGRFAGEPP